MMIKTKIIKTYFVLLVLMFTINPFYGQTPTYCDDGGFETDNFNTNGWILKSYNVTNNGNPLNYIEIITFAGSPTINTTGSSANGPGAHLFEYVDNSTNDAIHSTLSRIFSGNSAMKLGDFNSSHIALGISKNVFITNSNKFLNFKVARVSDGADAYFAVKVNGVAKPLNNNVFPIPTELRINGFIDWTDICVDLSQYLNQTIELEFYNSDCMWGGHYGYTYIDDITCSSTPCISGDGAVTNFVFKDCDKFCFNYNLPYSTSSSGVITYGQVNFKLKYKDPTPKSFIFSNSNNNSSTSAIQSCCFDFETKSNMSDFEVEATYTINGTSWLKNSNVISTNLCFPCCKEELVYSTTKQGYNRSLPVITASNAQHREVDFCSFEENNFDLSKIVPAEDLYDGLMPKLNATFLNADKSMAHSGTYSLKVNQNLNYSYDFKVCTNDNPNYQYIFNLDKEKNYRIQFWVKHNETINYTSPNIFEILFFDNTNTLISSTGSLGLIKTEKVEGWQLYELNYSLPSKTDKVSFKFKGSTNNNIRYFDDIKISPTNSMTKSYVYDEKSLKMIGELDENHFTTFYDYDEDGNLIRIRKETEKGIMTIKEMNINFQKGN